MKNKVITMELIGSDNLGSNVYKCVETGILYKDISLDGSSPELYGCGNEFDGDPSYPISKSFEIRFTKVEQQVSADKKFNYMMLDRLRNDCVCYLNSRDENRLWSKNKEEQIQKIKDIYNSFEEHEKPQWLTYEQILQYEKLMNEEPEEIITKESEEINIKSFECCFEFKTVVQTHGRNKEGAIENIKNFINEEIISGAQNIMGCGVDFDRENVEFKEVYNGWFQLNLLWNGYWNIDKKNEIEAEKDSKEMLDKRLTPFYQMLENLSTKSTRFQFDTLKDEHMTKIIQQ